MRPRDEVLGGERRNARRARAGGGAEDEKVEGRDTLALIKRWKAEARSEIWRMRSTT